MSDCGTPKGRGIHRRRGEQLCDACRVAWNEYMRGRQAAARARGWLRKDRPPPTKVSVPAPCSKCGKDLARTTLEEPLCAPCRGNRPGYNIRITPAARLAIYRRDDWTCRVCTEPVDQELPPNDTWAATLDHIIPRAQGGTDDPANLRLAHRWCNSVRGDTTYYDDGDLRIA